MGALSECCWIMPNIPWIAQKLVEFLLLRSIDQIGVSQVLKDGLVDI
jgi:hypothetical protein